MHQKANIAEPQHKEPRDGALCLYVAVRAALVAQGSSLSAWCRNKGISRQNAERALKGERHSPAARQLRSELSALLGI